MQGRAVSSFTHDFRVPETILINIIKAVVLKWFFAPLAGHKVKSGDVAPPNFRQTSDAL